ncbi:MAG: leucine-rich repeat domain-containing protein, partial [Saprospiraceae bacterium]|nr:leucine-rich repeat domain-containing protein [Saprospiraceae bacterium]
LCLEAEQTEHMMFFPAELALFKNLKSLYIRGGKITSLPPTIIGFPQLEQLHLENVGLAKLSKNILQLPQLKSLKLPNNQLVKLPFSWAELERFKEIDLSNNLFSLPLWEVLDWEQPRLFAGSGFEHLFAKDKAFQDFVQKVKPLAQTQRNQLYNLLEGKFDALSEITLTELFEFTQLKINSVDQKISQFLVQRDKEKLEQNPIERGSRIVLLGEIGIDRTSLIPILKKYKITVHKNIGKTTSHAVLGTSLKVFKNIEREGLLFASANALKPFLKDYAKEEKPVEQEEVTSKDTIKVTPVQEKVTTEKSLKKEEKKEIKPIPKISDKKTTEETKTSKKESPKKKRTSRKTKISTSKKVEKKPEEPKQEIPNQEEKIKETIEEKVTEQKKEEVTKDNKKNVVETETESKTIESTETTPVEEESLVDNQETTAEKEEKATTTPSPLSLAEQLLGLGKAQVAIPQEIQVLIDELEENKKVDLAHQLVLDASNVDEELSSIFPFVHQQLKADTPLGIWKKLLDSQLLKNYGFVFEQKTVYLPFLRELANKTTFRLLPRHLPKHNSTEIKVIFEALLESNPQYIYNYLQEDLDQLLKYLEIDQCIQILQLLAENAYFKFQEHYLRAWDSNKSYQIICFMIEGLDFSLDPKHLSHFSSSEREEFISRLIGLKGFVLRADYFDRLETVFYYPHATHVSMANMQLKKVPHQIFWFKELRYLSLSNNQLELLPSGFEQLDKLETLDLSQNNFQNIPACIREMENLRWIFTSANPLVKKSANHLRLPTELFELRWFPDRIFRKK